MRQQIDHQSPHLTKMESLFTITENSQTFGENRKREYLASEISLQSYSFQKSLLCSVGGKMEQV